jgi:hypothetical protein
VAVSRYVLSCLVMSCQVIVGWRTKSVAALIKQCDEQLCFTVKLTVGRDPFAFPSRLDRLQTLSLLTSTSPLCSFDPLSCV